MIKIKELKNGDLVEGLLAVQSRDGPGEGLRDYSNKAGRFFVIRVGNSTGNITLKYWGSQKPEKTTGLFSSIGVGDVIHVKGRCTHDSFSKELVISINEEVKYGAQEEFLKKADEGGYSSEDFLPALSKDKIEALFNDLHSFVRDIKDPHLTSLLQAFFGDEGFSEIFKKTPAAKRHHHNYIGGLLEHTVNVTRLCDIISGFYPLNRDLLITGALLHYIVKTREYALKASIDITDEGRFIGHLTLSSDMVREKIEELSGFPEAYKQRVIHMMISHHGELEKGSPKVPAFPEAMALYHADYMDAFVKNSIQELEERDGEEWIYSKTLKRFLTSGDEGKG